MFASRPVASCLEAALRRVSTADDVGERVQWPVDLVDDSPFEIEVPTVPPGSVDEAAAWEELANRTQDRSDELDVRFRAADAARTEALLIAYEASMEDLRHRFGAGLATRGSAGAQAFFSSTGLRWGISPRRIAHLVDTGRTLRDRLPRTWAAYLDGAATWQAVDLAVAQADGLEPGRWAGFDDLAADVVCTAAASRMKDRLRRMRARLQDDTAAARARTTEQRRTARLEPGDDGSACFVLTGPALPLVGFDTALTRAAIVSRSAEGEERTISQLRHDITVDLLVEGIKHSANPAFAGIADSSPLVPDRQGVTPTVALSIPALAALGHTSEQAILGGYGPIDLATAKRLAGTATSFTRVLTDPITGVRIDMDRATRVPPADMRRWVIARDETCRFPGCNRPARLCDLDHVKEWHDGGVTAADNLVSLHRGHHLAKTLQLWQEELEANGAVDWDDPWGHRFTDPSPPGPDPAPAALIDRAKDRDLDDCPF